MHISKQFALLNLIVFAITPLKGLAQTNPLTGTWTLVAADVITPDGKQRRDYGPAPKGLLMIDAEGHYSLQIYDSDRPKFAAGQKNKGTPDEYQAALMGSSIHYGTLNVDVATHTLTLNLEGSNYPNQEATTQVRVYGLKNNVLSYRVAARPDGSVPISVWQRLR